MGIFNFFITFPQIVNGLVGGIIVKYLYGGEAIFAIVSAGIFLIIAAVSVLYVQEKDRSYIGKISLAKTVATEPTWSNSFMWIVKTKPLYFDTRVDHSIIFNQSFYLQVKRNINRINNEIARLHPGDLFINHRRIICSFRSNGS